MQPADDPTPAEPSRKSPARRPTKPTVIGTQWRVVSASLGFIGEAAGGWAVFKTNVEAGPVALMLLGAVFLLIAMSGRLPNVLKFGDNEIGWTVESQQELGDSLAEAYETGDFSQKGRILQTVTDLSYTAPTAARAPMEAAAYEQLVSGMLLAVHRELNRKYPVSGAASIVIQQGDGKADFFLITGGRSMPLLIRASEVTALYLSYLEDLYQLGRGERPLLLITRAAPSGVANIRLGSIPAMRQVTVRDEDDLDALISAIEGTWTWRADLEEE